MSDTNATEPAAPPPGEGPVGTPIRVLGQYIKDLSFEVPHAPEIFSILRDQSPEIPVTVETDIRHLGGSSFEVTIALRLEATVDGRKAFILELVYGATVELNEQIVPQEHVHPVLFIEVPRLMFPFARQIIADVTVNGGFPPLMLQMFDFTEMYRKKFGLALAPDGAAPPKPSVH